MATQRLTMRNIRQILRQKLVLHRTNRDIAASVGRSPATVSNIVVAAKKAEITWARVEEMSDEALEVAFYGAPEAAAPSRPPPDLAAIHVERRRPGVTLALLHEEYLAAHPDGYRYTQYCELYRQWVKKKKLTMRIDHVAGDKAFVDYSGDKLHIVDQETGECRPVELFVGVLGASNYTFVDVTMSQGGADFIATHIRMLEYFGGVPKALVPDQLKSAVTRSCWYDPKIQRTYEAMAEHYETAVMPARPRKPRDKAKAEVGVQVVQRWILARLRNETFYSLDDLRARVAELLEDLNSRPMKKLGGVTRRQLFERLERAELQPLPRERFAFCEWKECRVNIDYHVEVDHHFYSVPHELVGEIVSARITTSTVEIIHRDKRICSHVRSYVRGKHTTKTEHMPLAHQKHLEWTPSRIIEWARQTGPKTAELAEAIMKERRHPEQGYRSCLGLLRLGKTYGAYRLEAACARAVVVRARSYRNVKSILDKGLDRVPLPDLPDDPPPQQPEVHGNIRGPHYWN